MCFDDRFCDRPRCQPWVQNSPTITSIAAATGVPQRATRVRSRSAAGRRGRHSHTSSANGSAVSTPSTSSQALAGTPSSRACTGYLIASTEPNGNDVIRSGNASRSLPSTTAHSSTARPATLHAAARYGLGSSAAARRASYISSTKIPTATAPAGKPVHTTGPTLRANTAAMTHAAAPHANTTAPANRRRAPTTPLASAPIAINTRPDSGNMPKPACSNRPS